MSEPAVDVIIAARDEAHGIGACIDALRRQTYSGDLRICVIDDGSRDGTAGVAATRGAGVLSLPPHGRGAARNAGLQATSGPLVAFLDAHVMIPPDWVQRMVEPFGDPRIGGCQSAVEYRAIASRVERSLRASAAVSADSHQTDTVRGERTLYPWITTGHSMYRRHALESAGTFNEDLVACEDMELSWRVVARGYHLGYVSHATAIHYEQRSWLGFVAKAFSYGRGAAQVEHLYRPHGARTRFGRTRMPRHPEEALTALCYRLGFYVQRLGLRCGLGPRLQPIAPRAVDAAFRPWFDWMADVRLRISPRTIFWSYDDTPVSVVVQPDLRQRTVLEGTADFIWRLVANATSREMLVDRIVVTYGVAPEVAAHDLDELMAQLLAAGLIECNGEPLARARET